MKCSYRQALAEDILVIAPEMKQIDRNELALWSGMDPFGGLGLSFAMSVRRWTMLVDGRPLGMGGVTHSGKAGVGTAWLLSREIPRVARTPLMKFMMRDWLPAMHGVFPVLGNFVDSRNAETIRWLERCGFEKKFETTRMGMLPWPFHRMERRVDRNKED